MSGFRLFDVLMVYLDSDWALVNKLCAILYKSVKFDGGESVSICSDLLDIHDGITLGSGKLDFFELALQRSNFAFLFFGNQPVDSWTKIYQDMVQMYAINRQGILCVPVKLKRDTAVPTRFEIYQPIELSRLLCGHSLETLDVESLTVEQLDHRILENITRSLAQGRAKRQKESGAVGVYNSQSAYEQIWKSEALYSNRISKELYATSAASVSVPAEHRPHERTLQKNFFYLTNNVLVQDSGLLDSLYSQGVLNDREKAKVKAAATDYDQAEELLCLLLRKSENDYQQFVQALGETNQQHIAEKLQLSLDREK